MISVKQIVQHNQMTFSALLICLLITGGFFGCHWSQAEKEAVQLKIADAAEKAAPLAPPPYKELLVLISALLSSGIFVDNRRKDVAIKVLKNSNAHQKDIIQNTLNPVSPGPPEDVDLHHR